MYNPINTYLIILKNTYTKQVNYYTFYNQSDNYMFYTFNLSNIIADLDDGEYEYYLLWCTINNFTVNINDYILDSEISVDGNTYKLSDFVPETGILKVIKTNNDVIQLDNEKNYISL